MLSPAVVTDLRLVGAAVFALLLLWWSYERIVADEPDDPVLRSSLSSQTGSASILLSGSRAVGFAAVMVAGLLLAPWGGGPLVANPQPVLLGLGVLYVAHWAVEADERE